MIFPIITELYNNSNRLTLPFYFGSTQLGKADGDNLTFSK